MNLTDTWVLLNEPEQWTKARTKNELIDQIDEALQGGDPRDLLQFQPADRIAIQRASLGRSCRPGNRRLRRRPEAPARESGRDRGGAPRDPRLHGREGPGSRRFAVPANPGRSRPDRPLCDQRRRRSRRRRGPGRKGGRPGGRRPAAVRPSGPVWCRVSQRHRDDPHPQDRRPAGQDDSP